MLYISTLNCDENILSVCLLSEKTPIKSFVRYFDIFDIFILEVFKNI